MSNTIFKSSFTETMNQFLEIRAATLKERTIAVNRRQLQTFDDYLFTHNNQTITKDVVDGWIGTLTGSESTVQHAICTIRLFIMFMMNSGISAYVPTVPKVHDAYIPYIFSDDEIQDIIKIADSYTSRWNNSIPLMHVKFPVIIRISLCCGLRLSEVVSLKIRDFHSEDGILVIEDSKNNKSRIVPMHETLTELLVKYCLLLNLSDDPNAWLFPGKDTSSHVEGEKIYFRFARVLEQAGISISKEKYERGPCFHCLRHYFVLNSFKQLSSMGISVDNSVPYLSIFLGHNSLVETERYMKFNTSMFMDQFQKFAVVTSTVFPEVHYEEN